MIESTTPLPRDDFVYRLLAASASAIALITAAYGAHFAFMRAPAIQRIFSDVRLDALTRLFIAHAWIPLAFSVLAALSGILAWKCPRPKLVAFAFASVTIAVMLAMLAELSTRYAFERILEPLR